MSNPQSQLPSAQMPNYTSVITQPDGTPSLLFHRFLLGIWQRTGGAQGVSGTDVAQIATNALTIARAASTEATAAEITATAAQATANTAVADALAAANAAAGAQTTASSSLTGALTKVNNLSDLNNIASARSNLGLSVFPVGFAFDTCPGGLKRGYPIVRAMTIPANFAGVQVWWGIAASGTAVFSIGVSTAPSTVITPIGTITIVASTGTLMSVQAAVSLAVGQTLVVTCPSPDPTLAQVSFTFPMILV